MVVEVIRLAVPRHVLESNKRHNVVILLAAVLAEDLLVARLHDALEVGGPGGAGLAALAAEHAAGGRARLDAAVDVDALAAHLLAAAHDDVLVVGVAAVAAQARHVELLGELFVVGAVFALFDAVLGRVADAVLVGHVVPEAGADDRGQGEDHGELHVGGSGKWLGGVVSCRW